MVFVCFFQCTDFMCQLRNYFIFFLRCLLKVHVGGQSYVQALKSLLKLCGLRMQFYYFSAVCF
jgi:hypothetical protein